MNHFLLYAHDTSKETGQFSLQTTISSKLKDFSQQGNIYNLVKTYQTHTHSKTRIKYRKMSCTFTFGHFFTEKTIIAKPLSEEIDKDECYEIFKRRDATLTKVKNFIDQYLRLDYIIA